MGNLENKFNEEECNVPFTGEINDFDEASKFFEDDNSDDCLDGEEYIMTGDMIDPEYEGEEMVDPRIYELEGVPIHIPTEMFMEPVKMVNSDNKETNKTSDISLILGKPRSGKSFNLPDKVFSPDDKVDIMGAFERMPDRDNANGEFGEHNFGGNGEFGLLPRIDLPGQIVPLPRDEVSEDWFKPEVEIEVYKVDKHARFLDSLIINVTLSKERRFNSLEFIESNDNVVTIDSHTSETTTTSKSRSKFGIVLPKYHNEIMEIVNLLKDKKIDFDNANLRVEIKTYEETKTLFNKRILPKEVVRKYWVDDTKDGDVLHVLSLIRALKNPQFMDSDDFRGFLDSSMKFG